MLVNFLQLILNCKKVFSDLSITDIQKTVDKVFVNDLEPLKETIANPLFGFIADKAGLIYNIRFFSPYINPAYLNEKRDFKKDKSEDLVTSFLIHLYPSPAGQLVTNTGGDYNPFTLFKSDIEESVRFFAKLFVSILQDKDDFCLKEIKTKDILMPGSRKELFNKLKKYVLKKNKDSVFDDKTIKLVLVHSYIINIFDPCTNSGTEDNLKLYLSEIGKFYKQHLDDISKNSGKDMFLDIRTDKEIFKAAVYYYKSLNSFPYSRLNHPESNKSIPSYIRKKVVNGQVEKVGEFTTDKNDMFSDCADIVLLHICNCLFFRNGSYDLTHLPDNICSAELKNFYINHPKPYTLTIKIRNEWSKVIQDLNEGEDDNSKYPTDHISYKKNTNNEVKSGIINMMNVLIKIAGLDAKDFFDTIDEDKLQEKLKNLIKTLSVKEKRNGKDLESVARLDLNQWKVKEFDTKIRNKKDFTGNFTIEFEYLNKTKEKIQVSQGETHAFVILSAQTNDSVLTDEEKRELKMKLAKDYYHNLLFKSFLFSEENSFDFNIDNFWKKIYLSGKMNTDVSNLYFLETIFCNNQNINHGNFINPSKLINLVLDKVDLTDLRTRTVFKKFVCFKKSVIQKDDFYLVKYGYIECKDIKSNILIAKWDEFFSNEIKEIEFLNLSYPFEDCKHFALEEQVLSFLIEKLGNFTNITKIKIEDSDLNKRQLKNIIKKLSNPKKILELELSDNNGLKIPKEIEILTNLKSIDISRCEMKKIPNEICNLNSLEALIMQSNRISSASPKVLKSLKNLKILNLGRNLISSDFLKQLFEFINPQVLNISQNQIFVLPSNIGKLTQLKVLDISSTEITDLPNEFINLNFLESIILSKNHLRNLSPYVFENLKFLKKVVLSETSISNDFLKILFDCKNLEELDISKNEIKSIPNNIGNLFKLKILNIVSNFIRDLPVELTKIQTLKEIYLSHNILTEETIRMFSHQIF